MQSLSIEQKLHKDGKENFYKVRGRKEYGFIERTQLSVLKQRWQSVIENSLQGGNRVTQRCALKSTAGQTESQCASSEE